MNMPLVLLNRRRRAGGFSPQSVLFGLNEPGIFLDPSDQTTLFQDTAGTTPVTTPGQTVARINDKSGRGNNATQATTASRPIYGINPVGGTRNILRQTATLPTQTRAVTAAQHTLSFRGTGTVTLTGASIAGPLIGTGAGNIVSLTFTPSAGNLTLTVLGTVNDAQLELGSARSGYQLVSDAGGYNVTEAGVASVSYLAFDGVDDFLVTPTITPGIDKAQVFAGVRKLSDATTAVVAELSGDVGGNNGSFALYAPGATAAADYRMSSRGTVTRTLVLSRASPDTAVLTGRADISAPTINLSRNGVAAPQNVADQGTGNYLAYPLYVGRRGGTTLPFNGQLYSLVVRFGANLDAATISNTETWVAGRTGVTL
jgi:hypothetical protein